MPPKTPKGTRHGGRKKGTPNKATVEIKAFCRGLFERPRFRENLERAWDDLSLDPSYRALLTHYAFGKPATAVDLSVSFDLEKYLARDDADHREP